MNKVIVKLVKAARKSGGDRYESEDGFVIYIPQEISRSNGKPAPTVEVVFNII